MSDAFFLPDGDAFVPQVHATGPWSAEFLHGGPPCALLTRAFERKLPDDFQLTRLQFELLRPVPFTKLTVKVEVEEQGANVRRGTASLEADGKTFVRATAMAFRKEAMEVEEFELAAEPPPPAPAKFQAFELPLFTTPVGYHTAMEVKFARGVYGGTPVSVWMRMRIPLLPNEKPSPFVRTVCAADSGNGVAQAVDFAKFTFVNADLSLSFLKRPKGEWICLEAHTIVTKDGIGLSDTRLWDERGPFGRGDQSLVVRARKPVTLAQTTPPAT
jgi:acyl-CoA thioesterase